MDWPRYLQPQVETAHPDAEEQLRLLQAQLGRVWELTPFYHGLFDEWGFRPAQLTRLDDVRHVPPVTKSMVRQSQQAAPPLGLHAAVQTSRVIRLHLTSGTTGHPVLIGLTERDSAINSLVGARAFWAAGFRPDDVVLHCLNYSFYAGGMADHLAVERTGAAVVPVGIGQSRRLLELAGDLKPTGMFSITSYPFHLAKVAEQVGIDPRSLGVRKLVVGGEPGGSLTETQAQLGQIWGARVRDTYGLSEVVSTFAGQCEVGDGLHFLAHDVIYPELVDPLTGEPISIEAGAEGELVFTHLVKEATPLIRYRSGDIARIIACSCPCGRTGFRFQVLGRTDDMFIVRGVNVFPSAIEAVVRDHVPAVSGEFTVVLDNPTPTPPVRILVEGAVGVERRTWQGLALQLEEAIRRRLQFAAQIVVVAPGTLRALEHKTPRIVRLFAGDKPPA